MAVIKTFDRFRDKAERENYEIVHNELTLNGIHDYTLGRNGVGHLSVRFYRDGKSHVCTFGTSQDTRARFNVRSQIRRTIAGRQKGVQHDARG